MTAHPSGSCPDRYLYDQVGTRYRITTVTRLALGPMTWGTDCDHQVAAPTAAEAPDQGSLWDDTP